jgi:alpha-tubulin suppressor-like RCC1 family protein
MRGKTRYETHWQTAIAWFTISVPLACHSTSSYGVGTPCSEATPCRSPLICDNGSCALESDASVISGTTNTAAGSGGNAQVGVESGGTSSWVSSSGGNPSGGLSSSGGSPIAASGGVSSTTALNSGGTHATTTPGGANTTGGTSSTGGTTSGGTTSTNSGALGQGCSLDNQCQTSHCVDGVCCESACGEQCKVCNVSDNPGYCVPLKDGQPKAGRPPCVNANTPCGGSCTGAATCSYPSALTTCDTKQGCINRVTQRERMICDGQGQCAVAIGTGCNGKQVCNVNLDARCGLPQFTAIETTQSHTCAVASDGTLYCWGLNDEGQLGWPATNSGTYLVPQLVPNQQNVRTIATGSRHTCALYWNGQVACWGHNDYGQLGCSNAATPSGLNWCLVPTKTGIAVAEIEASGEVTCARLADGTAQCWGRNDEGELGNGSTVSSADPVTVYNLTHAAAISVGVAHNCALIDNGTVKCWGSNFRGSLGDGTETGRVVPTTVLDPSGQFSLSNVTTVSAGSTHTCVLLVDGTIECFGEAAQGQFGAGLISKSLLPVVVPFTVPAIGVVAGIHFTCALANSQLVQCVGSNDMGQLGNGSITLSYDPVAVQLPLGLSFKQILSKYDDACLLSTDGRVLCWGNNDRGQIGNSFTTNPLIPTEPISPFGG